MGHIIEADIPKLIEEFHVNTFVETGTYKGDGLKWVYKNTNFKEYHSIEFNKNYYDSVLSKFPENNIHIYFGDTIDQLPFILDKIPQEDVILFWLDAHLPEFSDATCVASTVNTRIPLQDELTIIKQKRTFNHDVIFCDDLRIYEDGPFPHGNWDDRLQFGDLGTQFIYNTFSDSHNITKIYKHEGYILITPKVGIK